MNESSCRRFLAALVAASLAAFGPGLSGYEAAAQMRSAPVVNEGFTIPSAVPMDDLPAGAPSLTDSPLFGAGSLDASGALALPDSLAPASSSKLPSSARSLQAAERRSVPASARASEAALKEQSERVGETLKGARDLSSMSAGSLHGIGATLEEILTRGRSVIRAGGVDIEPAAGLGELHGPATRAASRFGVASRSLSAAPEREPFAGASQDKSDAAAFTRRVYDWMSVGLGVTAFFAYAVGRNAAMTAALFSSPALVIGLVIAELGLVIGLGLLLPKLSFQAAAGGFLTYAALNGVLLSSVLQVYAAASVVAAFGVTAGMFAGVAAFGHLTKKDLSGIGMYAGMALWGLILASVANMFLHSSGLNAVLNYAGVLVFTGLTAFDAQKIRRIGESGIGSRGPDKNLAIWGALTLYLDFVNLFLYILKIMGKAKEKK